MKKFFRFSVIATLMAINSLAFVKMLVGFPQISWESLFYADIIVCGLYGMVAVIAFVSFLSMLMVVAVIRKYGLGILGRIYEVKMTEEQKEMFAGILVKDSSDDVQNDIQND